MIHLSGRTFLRLSGPDSVRYLNGQVTNDVAKLEDGKAIQACVTNIKGKLEAEIFIRRHKNEDAPESEDFLLIDAPPELREDLHTRLDRYIISDDCELTDVSDQFALFHTWSQPPEPMPRDTPHTLFATHRFGVPGNDILSPASHAEAIHDHFANAKSLIGPDDLLLHRIRHRVPAWGCELTPGILPPEAGLDATAIDFHKGCYIGQEVISRIKSVGRVNRSLQLLVSTGPVPELSKLPSPAGESGLTILSATDSPALIGKVTSIAYDPELDRTIALGFVKRGHEEPGTHVLVQTEDENILSCPFKIRKTPEN